MPQHHVGTSVNEVLSIWAFVSNLYCPWEILSVSSQPMNSGNAPLRRLTEYLDIPVLQEQHTEELERIPNLELRHSRAQD
mmetsp:Transcript_13785/g.55794  ORF Transcript_13785/g.55794 Transcript_13785/m.55794 type:complete len:80 (+) Transcript_13785:2619-2858(+)